MRHIQSSVIAWGKVTDAQCKYAPTPTHPHGLSCKPWQNLHRPPYGTHRNRLSNHACAHHRHWCDPFHFSRCRYSLSEEITRPLKNQREETTVARANLHGVRRGSAVCGPIVVVASEGGGPVKPHRCGEKYFNLWQRDYLMKCIDCAKEAKKAQVKRGGLGPCRPKPKRDVARTTLCHAPLLILEEYHTQHLCAVNYT